MKQIKMNIKSTEQNSVIEAFKTLRTNIMFCGQDVKTISFTSCTPNDGKSTVSWNLALSIAESGKKVIYIDADMRKSVFTARMRVQSKVKGLSEFLSQQLNIDEILYQTEKKNLYVVFSGKFPPNPSELLGSKTFLSLIAALRENFDYVIVDTPPIGNVIDGAVVSTACDATVLVLSYKNTSYKLAQRIKKQLDQTGAHLIGTVLNKVNVSDMSHGDYNNYKYYGDYYGEQSAKDDVDDFEDDE